MKHLCLVLLFLSRIPLVAADTMAELQTKVAELEKENRLLMSRLQLVDSSLDAQIKRNIPSREAEIKLAQAEAELVDKSYQIASMEQRLAEMEQRLADTQKRMSIPSRERSTRSPDEPAALPMAAAPVTATDPFGALPMSPDPFGAPPLSPDPFGAPAVPAPAGADDPPATRPLEASAGAGAPTAALAAPSDLAVKAPAKATGAIPTRIPGRGDDDYAAWVDHFRMRAYEAQFIESRIVFGVVLLIVLCGLAFSGYHLYWTQHRLLRRRGKDAPAPDIPSGHTLKMGKDGVELSSPVLGLMILGLSVLFLFLYLRFIYPITVVSG